MQAYIFIDNMRVHAYHGVLEQERVVGNDYEVTLKVGYPLEKACVSDELNDTINYAILAEIIKREMAVPSKLVESVAGRIVTSVSKEFPEVVSIHLKIKKIDPPMGIDCDGAGVEIEI